MNRLIFLLLIPLILTNNCKKDDEICCMVYDTGNQFIYINKDSTNLLDPEFRHAITELNTRVYYLKNGKKEKSYDQIVILDPEQTKSGKYEMGLGLNYIHGKKQATTLLELPGTNTPLEYH